MKKYTVCLLALCLLLAGCSKALPEKTADGADWDGNWVSLGNVLGVEEPGQDLVLRDNNSALAADDMYLASWTIGDGEPYVNENGNEVALYPVRLDVLVYGHKDTDAVRQTVADWIARQAETYDVDRTVEQNHNGQDYIVSAYTCKSESNPYARGVSAFGVYGNYAICVELNCQDSFIEDEAAILYDFLDICHYAVQ